MSHQKTKRVQSPVKGFSFFSETKKITDNLDSDPTVLYSSRFTHKRKPIFKDSAQSSSNQVSSHKKFNTRIFSLQKQFNILEKGRQGAEKASPLININHNIENRGVKFSLKSNEYGKLPNLMGDGEQGELPISQDEIREERFSSVRKRLFQSPVKSAVLTSSSKLEQESRKFVGSGYQKQLFPEDSSVHVQDLQETFSENIWEHSEDKKKETALHGSCSKEQNEKFYTLNSNSQNSFASNSEEISPYHTLPKRSQYAMEKDFQGSPQKITSDSTAMPNLAIQNQSHSRFLQSAHEISQQGKIYNYCTPQKSKQQQLVTKNTGYGFEQKANPELGLSTNHKSHIVESLKKLHVKMVQRAQACERVEEKLLYAERQNRLLKMENQELQRKSFNMSPPQKSQESVILVEKQNLAYKKQIMNAKTKLINIILQGKRQETISPTVLQELEGIMKSIDI